MPTLRILPIALLLFAVALLGACTTSKSITQTQTRLRRIADYQSANLESVSSLFEGYRKTDEEAVLYQLELGMLNHYQGEWATSAKHFEKADRAIERQYTKDISKNLKSFLVNDFQLPYEGEPYESIYLTTVNCLNYLHLRDTQGALVEMRRITHKLELLSDRYKGIAASLMKQDTTQAVIAQADEKLDDVTLLTDNESPPEIRQNSALGRFLTTILYGKTGASDDANIELQKLRTALSDQGRSDYLPALARASASEQSPSENAFSFWTREEWRTPDVLSLLFDTQEGLTGRPHRAAPSSKPTSSSVSVPSPRQLTQSNAFNTLLVSFAGQAPIKKERSFHIPLLIDGELIQLHFAVPVLKSPKSKVARVRAVTAGDTLDVPMIEDMQSVAQEMFDQKKPIIYTRAIVRSFLKAGATEGAEKLAEKKLGGVAGFFTEQAGNVMSSQAAQADTRGWQTMPGQVHALAVKLPEGTHSVAFEFLSAQGHVLKRRTQEVTVQGANQLALAESLYLK